jgi:hypothetical protein
MHTIQELAINYENVNGIVLERQLTALEKFKIKSQGYVK